MERTLPEAPARKPLNYEEELAFLNNVLRWRGAKKCLANYLGVSCSQITSYLSGDVIPSAEKYLSMMNFAYLPRNTQLTYLHMDDDN